MRERWIGVVKVEDTVNDIMEGIKDNSSVSSKQACTALKLIIRYISESPEYNQLLLHIANQLTSFQHTYWLIRQEILSIFLSIDYSFLVYIEKYFLFHPHRIKYSLPSSSSSSSSSSSATLAIHSSRISYQTRILSFIFHHLQDSDWRVVDFACKTIRDILPLLHSDLYGIFFFPFPLPFPSLSLISLPLSSLPFPYFPLSLTFPSVPLSSPSALPYCISIFSSPFPSYFSL